MSDDFQHRGPLESGADADTKLPMIVYGLYVISLAGIPAGIVGLIMAYINRGDVAGTWLESHYRWQIRTFWIGLLYFVIAGLTTMIFIGVLLMVAAWIWYAARVAIGWSQLSKGRAIKDPETWWI